MGCKCKKCGYQRTGDEEGFVLIGGGLVKCPNCWAVHYFTSGGELELVMEQKMLNRPELREKIKDGFIRPIFGSGAESVHLTTDLLTEEFEKAMVDQILALIPDIPKNKPPIVAWAVEDVSKDVANDLITAQWEADIKHYES